MQIRLVLHMLDELIYLNQIFIGGGQRKLLLAEMEFIIDTLESGNINNNPITVVYAGAAPGTHIKILSELFPSINFILIDPAQFTVQPTDKITTMRQLMTNELAQQLHDRLYKTFNTLFISDIRSLDAFHVDSKHHELKIASDMSKQLKWHDIIKPLYSMLKFRLPWDNNYTEYAAGKIYLPVFGPLSTTESRLVIPKKYTIVKYDNKKYIAWSKGKSLAPVTQVLQLSNSITKSIASNRTLAKPNIDPVLRYK
jgi:hypothetical protein